MFAIANLLSDTLSVLKTWAYPVCVRVCVCVCVREREREGERFCVRALALARDVKF